MKHKETNRPPAFGSTDSDDLATPAIKQAVAALLADRHAAKRDQPDVRNLLLVSYEITREPLAEGNPPETPELVASYEDLHPNQFDPEQWPALLSKLEALHNKFPDDAKIGNYLAALYSRLGREADTHRIVQDLYRRHPDYLFAITAMIGIHLSHDDLEKAGEILKNRFELSLMYPDRKIFHISEFTAFYDMIVNYHIAYGNLDAAQSALNIFEKVDPDHPAVKHHQQVLSFHSMTEDLAGLFTAKRRRKRTKGKK